MCSFSRCRVVCLDVMGLSEAQGDETLMCETCETMIRPIDRHGDGFMTCPKCESHVHTEVQRYNDRYDIDLSWDLDNHRWRVEG